MAHQRQIPTPLSKARDQTHNLMVPSQIRFRCTTTGTPTTVCVEAEGGRSRGVLQASFKDSSCCSSHLLWPQVRRGVWAEKPSSMSRNVARAQFGSCQVLLTGRALRVCE